MLFPLPSLIEARDFPLIRQQRLSQSCVNKDYQNVLGIGRCKVAVKKMILATVQTLRCSCCPEQTSAYIFGVMNISRHLPAVVAW